MCFSVPFKHIVLSHITSCTDWSMCKIGDHTLFCPHCAYWETMHLFYSSLSGRSNWIITVWKNPIPYPTQFNIEFEYTQMMIPNYTPRNDFKKSIDILIKDRTLKIGCAFLASTSAWWRPFCLFLCQNMHNCWTTFYHLPWKWIWPWILFVHQNWT